MNLPEDFKKRMQSQLKDSYEAFLASYEAERTYGLRYNPLKIRKEELVKLLAESGVPLELVPWSEEGFYYPPDAQPGKHPLHEAGAYYIQEPSAMAVVPLLDPQPDEKILDLCAAPGGKSTQIAGRQNGRGLLVANEMISSRAKILSQNIERIGAANVVVCSESAERLAKRFESFFDRILVDAPCSGEGMFRKDEHACGEWSLQQVEACAKRQKEILSHAVTMLKAGGVLVYSTCTFAPQEDEEIAEWLVKQYPQFTLEKSVRIWPHLQRGEGHFAARFRKEGTLLANEEFAESYMGMPERIPQKTHMKKSAKKQSPRTKNVPKERMQEELFISFCKENLSEKTAERLINRVQMGQLAPFGEQLYLLPYGIGELSGLKTERAGLQLGCCKKERFEPSHALAMALLPEMVKRTIEVNEPERYLCGETFSVAEENGWTLVTYGHCSLGWGKVSGGVLKNHYPKGLRSRFEKMV